MHRCFIQPGNIVGDRIKLDRKESYHLKTVLRIRIGDELIGFDGSGHEYQLVITALEKEYAEARMLSTYISPVESPVRIILAQALVKGEKMDFILQKAVELGVAAVVPLISQHVAFNLAVNKYAAKQERWQAIVLEACKQSGRTIIPQVYPIISWTEYLTRLSEEKSLNLLCYEKSAPPIKTVLRSSVAEGCSCFQVMIGPEGGWAETEIASAEHYGVHFVSLGPRILRTETAGLAALSILQYENGGMQ